MKKLSLVFLVLVALLVFPATSLALSCMPVEGPVEALKNGQLPDEYDTVFIATPIKFSGERADKIEMKVSKVIVGDVAEGSTVTVIDSLADSGWGLGWNPDTKEYVMTVNQDSKNPDQFTTNSCLPNQASNEALKDELVSLAVAKPSAETDNDTPKFEKGSDDNSEDVNQTSSKLMWFGKIAAAVLLIIILIYALTRYTKKYDDDLDSKDNPDVES